MNEWQVFLIIAEVVMLALAVGAPMLKLNSTITKLNVMLQNLANNYAESEKSNAKEHAYMWEHIEGQSEKIADHETRLQLIEKSGE